jgi:hypothetical protein
MNAKFSTVTISTVLAVVLVASLGIYVVRSFNQTPSTPSPTLPVDGEEPFPTPEGQKTTEELVAEAREDLAERLNITQVDITTKEIELITWNDASLGCPEPGKGYTQALVNGYRIVLEVKDKVYNYHTSLRHINYCPEELFQ